MEIRTGKMKRACAAAAILLLGSGGAVTGRLAAQNIRTINRYHDPVIIAGSRIPAFAGVPVNEIHVMRYSVSGDVWEDIPFQVDEKDGGVFDTGEKNGLLDPTDEIVFMARDLGDSAAAGQWWDDAAARSHHRVQVSASDTLNGGRGWATLYRSSTASRSPIAYVSYLQASDAVVTDYYRIYHGPSGVQQNLFLQPAAGGDDVDFLDRQKFRLKIKISAYGITKEITLKEEMNDNIYIIEPLYSIHVKVSKLRVRTSTNPVVRFRRSLTLEVRIEGTGFDSIVNNLNFPITYYPTYAVWQTGNEALPQYSQGSLTSMRLSTDLDPSSNGMIFYNPYNTAGIRIDGVSSTTVTTLDWPGRNWYLIVADSTRTAAEIKHASLVTLMLFEGSSPGSSRSLYFKDNKTQDNADSGDRMSYGDTGFQTSGTELKGTLNFTGVYYFLPYNLTISGAEALVNDHLAPPEAAFSDEELLYSDITLNTEPSGLLFTADGTVYEAPRTFTWVERSRHAVHVDSLQDEANGSRYRFSAWNRGGASSFVYQVPHENEEIFAQFVREHFLSTAVEPENGGTLSPDPPGQWFDEGASARVEAAPSAWNTFLFWSGDLEGGLNPAFLPMDGPKSVTAHFGNFDPEVSAPDTFMLEDESLVFSRSLLDRWASDANHPDSALMFVLSGGRHLAADIDSASGGFRLYSSVPDWNGLDTLLMTAHDPLAGEGSDSLLITVLPVPDPPNSFALLAPAQGEPFLAWPDTVEFSWETAVDPDAGDTVRYRFELDTARSFPAPLLVRTGMSNPVLLLNWPDALGDGTYYWRVFAQDLQAHSVLSEDSARSLFLATAAEPAVPALPLTLALAPNYPNPFNASTVIRFGLPRNGSVTLTVYNSQGQAVRKLLEGEECDAGYHVLAWDGMDEGKRPVSSGLYLVLLQTESERRVRKALLLR